MWRAGRGAGKCRGVAWVLYRGNTHYKQDYEAFRAQVSSREPSAMSAQGIQGECELAVGAIGDALLGALK